MISHIDQNSPRFSNASIGIYNSGIADNAVDMFFVLSGFLITFLLLKEKEKTSTINIRKFYMRRILRIWPLYYLVLILSLLMIYFDVIPMPDKLLTRASLYIFFLANIAFLIKLNISVITPLWSVGTEEQFYAIWPWIVKATKKYLTVFFILFITINIVRLIGYYKVPLFNLPILFFNLIRIDIMTLGAMGAVFLYRKHRILTFILNKPMEFIAWIVLLQSYVYGPLHVHDFIDNQINALFYLIIILNLSSGKSYIKLDHRVFDIFGKMSYGIYVYHVLIIYCLVFITKEYEISTFVYYTITILLTLIISHFSYKYFEMPFLRIKNKYAVVKSSALHK